MEKLLLRTRLLITCEHAGNRVPPGLKEKLGLGERLLSTHRGYDRGALELARAFRLETGGDLFYTDVSRLVVDANRSLHNPSVLPCRGLSATHGPGFDIVRRYYLPHRRAIEQYVTDSIKNSYRVFHLAVHTFTPVLRGKKRTADIGILYRPWCANERNFALEWRNRIAQISRKRYRVRLNYPYMGKTDGIGTALSLKFGERNYMSVTVELSQRFFAGSAMKNTLHPVATVLTRSFRDAYHDLP